MHVERPVKNKGGYTVMVIFGVVILFIIVVIPMSNLVVYQEEVQAKKNGSSNKKEALIELPQAGNQVSFFSPSSSSSSDIIQVLFKHVKNDTIGDWIINGKIKNAGVDSLTYLRIIAHVYDSEKQVVGVADTYADKQDLDPGQTSLFTLYISPKNVTSIDVKYYSLSFESA